MKSHWDSIRTEYRGARFFEQVAPQLESFYQDEFTNILSFLNERCIKLIASLIGVETLITRSTDYLARDAGRNARLVSICLNSGANRYVTGPAAKEYIDEDAFAQAGIDVCYVDYSVLPMYEQLHQGFINSVSIIDLLMNIGTSKARDFLRLGLLCRGEKK
jgi:hypothetical protein